MINSKILKKKFTVDTSLHHLYQMNQKAFKKQFSMITSKDDNATASLLGFAIANRVDPSNCKSDGNIDEVFSGTKFDKGTSKKDDNVKTNGATDKKDKGQKDGKKENANDKNTGNAGDSSIKPRKAKNSNLIQAQSSKSAAKNNEHQSLRSNI